MAVSNKDIQFLKGYRKPLSGGAYHFSILMSQPIEAHTEGEIIRIYVSLEEGGIGIIGSPYNGDLRGIIAPLVSTMPYKELTSQYRAVKSDSLGLSASFSGTAIQDLEAFYRATKSGYDSLPSFYRAAGSGYTTISGYYYPIQPAGIGVYILAIPPEDLYSDYLGVMSSDVTAEIIHIVPMTLSGTIVGNPYQTLFGTIRGTKEVYLNATTSGYASYDINANISGIVEAETTLNAKIRRVTEAGLIENLEAEYYGHFSTSGDLGAYIGAHPPADIDGLIYGIGPSSLFSYINPVPSGEQLEATISSAFPDNSLVCTIVAGGGYRELKGYIHSDISSTDILMGNLVGEMHQELYALLNVAPSDLLYAMISNSGNPTNMTATVLAKQYKDLISEYTGISGNLLQATIECIAPSELGAIIKPNVFFIESSLLINLFPYKNLRAIINAANCNFNSGITELQVYIKGITGGQLDASIIGVNGQYVIASDELEVLIKKNVITADWLPFIIDQPTIGEARLPIYLITNPLSDLQATIEGVFNSEILEANIIPLYYAPVKRDNQSTVEWVNTRTGERRLVRVYFKGNTINYYYSELANDTYSFSPEDHLVIEVEGYDKVETEDETFLSTKSDIKTCVVDNLTDFSTIDEAIRYGILCAVSERHGELRAIITAKGEPKTIKAQVTGNPLNLQKDLYAKYFPSADGQPTLSGYIDGSGGFDDLESFIKSQHAASTGNIIVDSSGIRYKNKLVTHGTNKVSIVLTKVISTDTMITGSPDLSANIYGTVYTGLGATITGNV